MSRHARSIRTFIYGISFHFFALLTALSGTAQAQTAPPRVQVVASFTILADFVRQVAGERAEVTSLVGPDSDAHVYRPTPADARKLKGAGLVIINGLGFESFMDRLIRSSGTRATVITATKGVEAKEADDDHDHAENPAGKAPAHDHGKLDPHAWQSIEAAKIYIGNIRDGMIKADPAGAEIYTRNATAYLGELTRLKADIEAAIGTIPVEKRVIITSHDALAYFGREFKFTMEAVQGVSTEGEPSAKDVARIIRLAKSHKAQAIFVENMTSPRIAEQISREAGAKLGGKLFSDALSDEKGEAPTYIAMMRHNAKMLIDALKN
jgi:zinc/manganese transport system substrate-binding protein